ncbi:hypothetical protein DL96DRAFT_688529 [Flagelloscypha sp. PMI_526]|nr:hypothetical protein DL96DRAFT_688529 [Flagelloscypha sp. PMI_526]
MLSKADTWALDMSTGLAYYNIAYQTYLSLLLGMFLMLAGTAIYILRKDNERNRPKSILCWSIVALVVLYTTGWALQTTSALMMASWIQMTSPDLPLVDRWTIGFDASGKTAPGQDLIYPTIYIIADAIPIWRAYVFWNHSKAMRTALVVLFVVNAGVCIARALDAFILDIKDLTGKEISAQEDAQIHFFTGAQTLVSAVVNAITTIIIGIKAWKHKAFIKQSHLATSSSTGIAVLSVLVETGFILCVVQIINSCVSIAWGSHLGDGLGPRSSFALAYAFFASLADAVAVSYAPLVVIFLFYRGSLLKEGDETFVPRNVNIALGDEENQKGKVSTIQFAPRLVGTTDSSGTEGENVPNKQS